MTQEWMPSESYHDCTTTEQKIITSWEVVYHLLSNVTNDYWLYTFNFLDKSRHGTAWVESIGGFNR